MKQTALNTMLLWDRHGKATLGPWPENGNRAPYRYSALACDLKIHRMSRDQRVAQVFIEAMHLIVRDGVDPLQLHHALLGLEEYRNAMADDMPS